MFSQWLWGFFVCFSLALFLFFEQNKLHTWSPLNTEWSVPAIEHLAVYFMWLWTFTSGLFSVPKWSGWLQKLWMTHCFNKSISGEQSQQKSYPDSGLSSWLHQLHLYKGFQTTSSEGSEKETQSAFHVSITVHIVHEAKMRLSKNMKHTKPVKKNVLTNSSIFNSWPNRVQAKKKSQVICPCGI